MSMSWEHKCRKCGKEFSSWDGIPLCLECFTEEDVKIVLAAMRADNIAFQSRESTSEVIAKSIRHYEWLRRAALGIAIALILLWCAILAGL